MTFPVSISARAALCALSLLACAGAAHAAEWHVSPSGSNTNTGASAAAPWRTLAYAVTQLQPGDTLTIHAGTYRESVSMPVSGTAQAPITLRAAQSGAIPDEVVITGFDVITPGANGAGQWQLHAGAIWKIALPAGWGVELGRNLVQVDGEVLRFARWPDASEVMGFDRREMAEADGGSVDSASIGPLALSLSGIVPSYTYTDFYDGQFVDADLAAFAMDEWIGAHVDVCVGHNWWPKTGVVTGNSGDRLDFQYRFEDGAGWDPVIDTPKSGDRYALWGHLRALDAPGEFFIDVHGLNGPADTLYVWLPDGGSPVGREVAVLNRETALDFGTRSHIAVENISIMGGAILTSTGSEGLSFDGVSVDFGSLNRNHLNYGAGRAVWLIGTNHRFENGRVGHSYRRTIEVNGSGHVIENNVLHDAAEHLLTLPGSSGGSYRRNTAFRSGNTAFDVGTVASLIELNHVYHAGMRVTDVAVLNTWNGGDMGGTEIRYNWVHSNLAPYDATRSWWGGPGIRLDSGGAPLGCSNALIHHNLVWGTSADSSITVWGLTSTMPNYGNAQVRVYHNTVENELVLGGGGSVAGNDWQRNLARGFSDFTGDLASATVAQNGLIETTLAGNWTGNPGYVSPLNHNYQLRTDSPVRDYGTPIPGITESGPEDYLGAYNPNAATPWRPGALLRTRDLPALAAEVQTDAFGGRKLRVHGLPAGRTFPDGFVVRLAGRDSTAMSVRYSISHDSADALFDIDLAGLSGSVAVAYSLDGVTFVDGTTPASITARAAAFASDAASDASGGSTHVLQLDGIGGTIGSRIPVHVSGWVPGDIDSVALPWVVDTAAWIADGMAADASDLRVLAADGATELRRHIESGLGKGNTLMWIMQRAEGANASAGGDTISFDDRSVLYLAYGDSNQPGNDDPALLGDSFPALALPNVMLHLQANRLQNTHADGAPVGVWPDNVNPSFDAVQATAGKQPLFSAASMGGLPAVRFDGVDDVLDVNGTDGIGIGPCRIITIYRNPDPGTVKWQRVFSARTDTTMRDYEGGLYMIVETDATDAPIAQPDPFMRDMNFPSPTASGMNFRIGGRSLHETYERFRGEIAEMIAFDGGLSGDLRDSAHAYLKRKYGIAPRPTLSVETAGLVPGIQVLVDGVPADGLQWSVEGELLFVAPPYAGSDPLPARVDVTVIDSDGSATVLQDAFLYRSAFQTWQREVFGAAADDPALEATLWGATADADADGLENLTEYAFGGDALSASDAPRPSEAVVAGRVEISFFRARADLSYVVLGSDDLTSWTQLAINPGSVGAQVTVQDSVPVATSTTGKRFLKVAISDGE